MGRAPHMQPTDPVRRGPLRLHPESLDRLRCGKDLFSAKNRHEEGGFWAEA